MKRLIIVLLIISLLPVVAFARDEDEPKLMKF